MIREGIICTECESKYFKDSSEMKRLCPSCAHKLYGYPSCEHEFENGNCKKCGWDGNISKFIKKNLKR